MPMRLDKFGVNQNIQVLTKSEKPEKDEWHNFIPTNELSLQCDICLINFFDHSFVAEEYKNLQSVLLTFDSLIYDADQKIETKVCTICCDDIPLSDQFIIHDSLSDEEQMDL